MVDHGDGCPGREAGGEGWPGRDSALQRGQTWLGFLRKERSIGRAVLTGCIRAQSGFRRLQAVGRCFPRRIGLQQAAGSGRSSILA